jgi:hypothetical protein
MQTSGSWLSMQMRLHSTSGTMSCRRIEKEVDAYHEGASTSIAAVSLIVFH